MTLREIIMRANTTCRRLGREEDGVVLSVVMVTLMSLYLMGAATVAVGEHIRDRIEIQNAVDAAAYSAAIVQADTLSRIAAINQAMAWTYIQMVKRHMDYIQDKWLEEIVRQYTSDKQFLKDERSKRKYNHNGKGYSDWISPIKINDDNEYSIQTIKSDSQIIDHEKLKEDINDDLDVLDMMCMALLNLIIQLPDLMRAAARNVLQQNLEQAIDYLIVLGERGRGDNASEGFESYGDEEDIFLKVLSDQDISDVAAFGVGADEWFPHQGNTPWRQYRQLQTKLKAEWDGGTAGWKRKKVYTSSGSYYEYYDFDEFKLPHGLNDGEVLASDVADDHFETNEFDPQRLNKSFFEQYGSIVVAVARPLRNPFERLFVENDGSGGFYDAFAENDGRRMMAVAAARAGYKDVDRTVPGTGNDGAYNPYNDSWEIDLEIPGDVEKSKGIWLTNGWSKQSRNLGQIDWDATLIPLRRAWSDRTPAWANRSGAGGKEPYQVGSWGGDSSEAVLGYLLTEADWQAFEAGQPGSTGLDPKFQSRGVATGFGASALELSQSLFH